MHCEEKLTNYSLTFVNYYTNFVSHSLVRKLMYYRKINFHILKPNEAAILCLCLAVKQMVQLHSRNTLREYRC